MKRFREKTTFLGLSQYVIEKMKATYSALLGLSTKGLYSALGLRKSSTPKWNSFENDDGHKDLWRKKCSNYSI